jgi:hypothetical protein
VVDIADENSTVDINLIIIACPKFHISKNDPVAVFILLHRLGGWRQRLALNISIPRLPGELEAGKGFSQGSGNCRCSNWTRSN